jgi:tetratricopeptide (TPR) repeat protein
VTPSLLLAALLAGPLGAQATAPPAAAAPAAPAPAPDLKAIAALVAKGQLGAAERQLRQILAQGNDANARALLGVVLSRQGKAEEAEGQLRQALAANPALGQARQQLARLYLAQNRESEAVVELRRAAQQEALERDLALKLASVEQAAGNPALAERQLRSAAERFRSVQALVQLARLQSSQKDASGALESLQRARAIAPNSEDVLSVTAQVALGARAPVPAILALEPLTRMCPTVGQYPYLLGVALMQAGDMVAAVEPLQKAERLEPDRALTLIALGLALNGRKLYAESKPNLGRALEREPDNVEALAALAEAEDGLGELANAEAHATRAVQKVSTHATGNLVLGMVRMKQERYEEAREALERAAASDPASPKAHYQLSLAYARLGDTANARHEVELYQQKLKEIEQRVAELRTSTGLSGPGGMRQ